MLKVIILFFKKIRIKFIFVRLIFLEKFFFVFGNNTNKNLIQLYRNDSLFKTIVSFNHFINYFSDYKKSKIIFYITAYNKIGKICGDSSFCLNLRGSNQFRLDDLINTLDDFGIFSVSIKIYPRSIKDISYLGTLSPQFMTLYEPQDKVSSIQMVHSHKKLHGFSLFPYNGSRSSANIEYSNNLKALNFYVLNSSLNKLNYSILLCDPKKGKVLRKISFMISAYGCKKVELNRNMLDQFPGLMLIKYEFDKPLSHVKPIVFRLTKMNLWSSNHT
jgi:hypothetical protein